MCLGLSPTQRFGLQTGFADYRWGHRFKPLASAQGRTTLLTITITSSQAAITVVLTKFPRVPLRWDPYAGAHPSRQELLLCCLAGDDPEAQRLQDLPEVSHWPVSEPR